MRDMHQLRQKPGGDLPKRDGVTQIGLVPDLAEIARLSPQAGNTDMSTTMATSGHVRWPGLKGSQRLAAS
jgi:hypothetical protein